MAIHGELNYMAVALCPLQQTKLHGEFMRRWTRVARHGGKLHSAISSMPFDLRRRLNDALRYMQIKL